MNTVITISVIIPCYNSEKTIKGCLKSILTQTERVDEIIVVDDGSTDNSVASIKEIFYSTESPIKLILHEQINAGPSAARNKGIQLSTSSHVAFLDSDDEWFSDHIYTIKTFLTKNLGYKMVATKYLGIPVKFTGEVLFSKMLFKNYFFTPCIVLNKDLFLDHKGFNENMKFAEDYYLWLNITFKNKAYLLDYIGAGNIIRKRPFGDHGLSSNLLAMHEGVLECFRSLYLNKMINFRTYYLVKKLENIKYFRRITLSYFYKNKKS